MNAIEKLELLASIYTDGHYSIFKFTTNYRVCLGTPSHRSEISQLKFVGETLDDAVNSLIQYIKDSNDLNINFWDMDKING